MTRSPTRPRSAAEPHCPDPIDQEVRALLAAGATERAATLVIQTYGKPVHRYFLSVFRDEDDAADAHSQWAERLWRGMAFFEGRSTVRCWTYRIATHVALGMRDEAWRRRRVRLSSGRASQLAAEERSRGAREVEHEQQELDLLRAELSGADQALLVMHVDQRLSWAEIAGAMAAEGDRANVAALQQRYTRLKKRIGRLARARGLVQ
jgi:DNA-directed RNA polymerase specialized sigma24 family protein